jgi:tight adherence protein B
MTSQGSSALVFAAVAAVCLVWPARSRRGSDLGPRAAPRRRAGRPGRGGTGDLADLLALLAAPLRAGVPPPVAVTAALRAAPVNSRLTALVAGLRRAAETGDSLADEWLAHGRDQAWTDLTFIGQAWVLTERTGAPLAEALADAERVLRDRTRASGRLDAIAAGPRASMAVLTALPLAGPLVGLTFGLSPSDLYRASPVSAASCGLGLGLTLLGWWWGRRILARALTAPVLGGSRDR